MPVYLLQTDRLKDGIHNNLRRETSGPGFIHFPDWIGEWFYDELTYEVRGPDGKWRKPGRGANEALDLFCYCHALSVLRGYERIKNWDEPPSWAKPQNLNESISGAAPAAGPVIVADAAMKPGQPSPVQPLTLKQPKRL